MWTLAPKTQFSFGPKNRYGSYAIINGLLGCTLIICDPLFCHINIFRFVLVLGIGKFG